MNQTNSTFDTMLKAAVSRDSAGATDTMLIHAHLAQMKMFGIRQGVEYYPEQDNFGSQTISAHTSQTISAQRS
jgi:hypothetical protein